MENLVFTGIYTLNRAGTGIGISTEKRNGTDISIDT